jgi:hypothetical protein
MQSICTRYESQMDITCGSAIREEDMEEKGDIWEGTA